MVEQLNETACSLAGEHGTTAIYAYPLPDPPGECMNQTTNDDVIDRAQAYLKGYDDERRRIVESGGAGVEPHHVTLISELVDEVQALRWGTSSPAASTSPVVDGQTSIDDHLDDPDDYGACARRHRENQLAVRAREALAGGCS
ncbi:MAG TPA: hypothetical protein VK611_21510 [Acidimicrobiales bacterium]|nr:hypothetical protein [Acidimicrobiales bacterium]